MIADQQGQTVWRWDNQEPFGSDLPNDDPGNTGNPFVFNLRFPGQYFDRETNLAYNFFRVLPACCDKSLRRQAKTSLSADGRTRSRRKRATE